MFKKHVRVAIQEFKSKRNFNFDSFGDQSFALMAASTFESNTGQIMEEFEKYGRKPTQRQKLLESHGVHESCFKKSISHQREQLVNRLFEGLSVQLEDLIIRTTCKNLHDPVLFKHSHVKREGTGFRAIFEGTQQKLEQSCKSLKAASDWLVQMHAADKDSLSRVVFFFPRNNLYVYGALVC